MHDEAEVPAVGLLSNLGEQLVPGVRVPLVEIVDDLNEVLIPELTPALVYARHDHREEVVLLKEGLR